MIRMAWAMRVCSGAILGAMFAGMFAPSAFAGSGPAILMLAPSAQRVAVGEAFFVDIVLDTQGRSVNSVSAVVSFNSQRVSSAGFSGAGSVFESVIEEVTGASTITVTRFSLSPPQPASGLFIERLHFRATTSGDAEFSFRTAPGESQVISNDDTGADILGEARSALLSVVVPGAASGGSSVPSVAPVGNSSVGGSAGSSSSPAPVTTGASSTLREQLELLQKQIAGLQGAGGASPTPTGAAEPFAVGGQISVRETVRVRSAASVASVVRGSQGVGVSGVILEGPLSAGGYRWWKINYDSGADGWSADAFLAPRASETKKAVSTRSTRITLLSRLRVRAQPGLQGATQGTQPVGGRGAIVDGPVDLDGYRWWKIDYDLGADGWSADSGFAQE
jgi:hypothetical protein